MLVVAFASLVVIAHQRISCAKRGQCGLAMPRTLVGVNPTWVNVSHEPSNQTCCMRGNRQAKQKRFTHKARYPVPWWKTQTECRMV